MLNSLEFSNKNLTEAKNIIDRNNEDKESIYHGIIYRIMGYQYWKFYKKQRSTEYLDKALKIFEKFKDFYQISTIYKEKGDMCKEVSDWE